MDGGLGEYKIYKIYSSFVNGLSYIVYFIVQQSKSKDLGFTLSFLWSLWLLMTFRCLSPYCKPSMIVMSQREDVHLYCPVFTSLLKLISLSRKDYCPALYTLANSDITSGRMYCPALYILTNSDITERILHCQGLMEFVFMLFYPGVDTSVTLFFSCWS